MQEPQKRYFDIITEGAGYLNRIRNVKPKKGPEYLACSIRAFLGGDDSIEFRSFDMTVVGAQAKQAVAVLRPLVEAEKTVIVGFRIGDIRPDQYQVTDKKTGEVDVRLGLKGRLLQLTFAKCDGQRVDIPLVQRPQAAEGEEMPRTGTEG